MSVLAQDFVKGLDLTTQPSWSGADVNQLVDAGGPANDKGLVVTTTDTGATPDVPNATTTTRWQRYLWRRVRNSGLSPILYYWNPNATSDATYLKWQAVSGGSSSAGALTFANYAALRAYDFTTLVTGQVTVFVLGYATAGDGGFGEFRYDSTDVSSADDDGRVLVTTVGSYRFRRITQVNEFAKPEWFGGFAGGSTLAAAQAVSKACRKCVAYYNTLEFGVGTYTSDDKVIVKRGTRVCGQGKRLTTFKIIDNSARVAAYTDGSYFTAFQWSAPGTTTNALVGTTYLSLSDEGPCDNAKVEQLSVDMNYDNQSVDGSNRFNCTMRAVELVGGGCIIDAVAAQQCGVGYKGGECFVFRIGGTSGQSNTVGGKILDVEYSNTGRPLWKGATLAAYGWPTTLGSNLWAGRELSIIALSLDTSGTQAYGEVSGSQVRSIKRTLSVYPNPIHITSVSGSKGANLHSNFVVDCDATCIYSDNTESAAQVTEGLRIYSNHFINVFRGVELVTGAVARQYHDADIFDNQIELYNTTTPPGYNMPSTPCGVMLHWNGGYSFTPGSDYPFRDIKIHNNKISGGGGFTPESGALNFYSRGVYFEIALGDLWKNIIVENNIIDVPQYDATAPLYYYPEANSLALYISDTQALFNNTLLGRRGNTLVLRGNTDGSGKPLPYMTCTNSVYEINFKYYQDDACITDATLDPLNAVASGLLDYAFPRSRDQEWFNTGYKRLWKAQDTRKIVASGQIVPGRTYVVQTDDGNGTDTVTYNGTPYVHGNTFNAVSGITVYASTGYARVYESPAYCWQPLTRNAVEIYSVSENTYPIYGISNDRFLDTRFFILFAAFNADCKIALPDPGTLDADGNKIYKGRTCFVRYGRGAITDAHEIVLACGSVAAGVLTPLTGKIVDPVMCTTVDELVLTPASKGALGGIVGLLCDGDYWFITSQVSDPQEILLYTQIGTSATSPNDFELTNWAAAPFYHNVSANLKDRQLKGLIYMEFPLTGDVGFYLPDPALFAGYQAKYCLRVGSGFAATVYCGTAASPLAGKIINPGLSGNKGEIVTSAVVSGRHQVPAIAATPTAQQNLALLQDAVDRLITVEVTSMGSYWLIMCN